MSWLCVAGTEARDARCKCCKTLQLLTNFVEPILFTEISQSFILGSENKHGVVMAFIFL